MAGDIPHSSSLAVNITIRSALSSLPTLPSTLPHYPSPSPASNSSSNSPSPTPAKMTAVNIAALSAAGSSEDILLITAPRKPTPGWVEHIQAKFPRVRVIYRDLNWGQTLPRESLTEDEWANVTVLLTTSSLPGSAAEVPRLRYVQLFSAGANLVTKQPLFTDTDIIFATANGVHGPQISEWIIATFLAHNHKIPHYLELQKQAKWRRSEEDTEDSLGQRVGILGYGSIGRQTARVATALGLEVYAYTLHPRDTPKSRRDNGFAPPGTGDPEGIYPTKWFSGGTKADRHAFLASGLDLLVVATPLTDDTTNLLGAEELKLLGRNREDGTYRAAFLSNIARGPIVDTDALIAALENGTLRGAALDVTDPEPLPDGHRLWSAKNLIVTPHISGSSTKYAERVLAILEDNLERLRDGRPLANKVSRREGY